jgi:predicted amidohydrolase YtcJ
LQKCIYLNIKNNLRISICCFSNPNVGLLSPGYPADFIVLNQNILEVEPQKIDETRVLETYMGGELVYQSKLITKN